MAKNFDDFVDEHSKICMENDFIPAELYTKYDVKKGLRDSSGKGVLTGLTNISRVDGFVTVDGKRTPCEGCLWYRGYDVYKLVDGLKDNRFGFEEAAYLLLFGNLPSEHFEAPNGPYLVDTIYTANWTLLGFVSLTGWLHAPEYLQARDRLARLLADIQDTSAHPAYCGCWRGLFDLEARTWGGGDCFEGGAGSIYTGWTNAPITIALLLVHHKLSICDLLP